MLRKSLSPNKITAVLLVMFMLLSMSSCAKTPTPSDITDTVTFTDALGREVTVSETPSKTAALIGSFADVWQLAGGTVCACADDGWDDFGLDLEGAVNIGGAHSPNLELLLGATPDFVLASASVKSNVDMEQTLENAGVTVAYFDVDNFEDYLEMLDICTDITGRKDLYQQNGLDIKIKIDTVKKEFEAMSVPTDKRTVLLVRASSGSVKVKNSEGTVLGEMLNDIGCINIADSDSSLLEDLNVESIIKSNPYRIFAVTMGNDTDAAISNLTDMIGQNPAWKTLDAVKYDRIHVMDRKLFNLKPNSKWGQAYEILYDILKTR